MVHPQHRPVVAIIYLFRDYCVVMYMYECLEQMLRPKDTFNFDHELTTNMTHCRPKICKFILAFHVAKIVQREDLDLRREKKVDRHSKPSDFLRGNNGENTKLRRTIF